MYRKNCELMKPGHDIVQCFLQVWAIDNRRQVYARRGVTENMPIGEEWVHVPGKSLSAFLIWYHRFQIKL